MTKILVNFNAESGDGREVEGFYITTKEELDAELARIEEYFETVGEEDRDLSLFVEVYFDGDDSVLYSSFSDVLDAINVTPITCEEESFLRRVFYLEGAGYGIVALPSEFHLKP